MLMMRTKSVCAQRKPLFADDDLFFIFCCKSPQDLPCMVFMVSVSQPLSLWVGLLTGVSIISKNRVFL